MEYNSFKFYYIILKIEKFELIFSTLWRDCRTHPHWRPRSTPTNWNTTNVFCRLSSNRKHQTFRVPACAFSDNNRLDINIKCQRRHSSYQHRPAIKVNPQHIIAHFLLIILIIIIFRVTSIESVCSSRGLESTDIVKLFIEHQMIFLAFLLMDIRNLYRNGSMM